MDLSKLPAPISYAIALLIVVLGLSTAFRIYQGSGIDIATPLGDISIPAGDEKIPLRTFVEESQKALALADEEINTQSKTINALENRLKKSRAEVANLKALSEKLAQANSSADKTLAARELASAARLAQTQVTSVSVAQNTNVEKAIKQQITLLNKIDWSEKVSVKK